MSFQLTSMLGLLGAGFFGLAFLLAPVQMGELYGVSGWNAGTTAIGRFFGAGLLYGASALWAVKHTVDARIQRGVGFGYSAISLVAGLVALQSVMSGGSGPLMWSTVAIFTFYTVVWFLAARAARG